MGVPAFFRWLSKKYPSIVAEARKDSAPESQYHFDNLYLDMNGIIHPCSHPENKPPPANEEEMFLAIFEYVEDIMRIVKPQKLIYMAVDGVAPRAKMNQQRSRRFRAAQESQEKQAEIAKVKERLREEGHPYKEKEEKAHFDSNVITPGTDFMLNLSEALRSWLNRRLSPEFEDKYGIWPKDMVIILSDASSPGEGEHKIMEFIRKQKASDHYHPGVSHCLYGADADLIMLGLATHEPNFTILREEFKPNQPRPCELCGQIGHVLKDCLGEEANEDDKQNFSQTDFIYIRLNILREYLERESQNCKVSLNFERFIDDWIFMCFFVGNDFLPHLPSLEIRENAIDRLITLYKAVMESSSNVDQDYLTDSGFVNKERAQMVLLMLGEAEDDIFKHRKVDEDQHRERMRRNKIRRLNDDLKWLSPVPINEYGKRPFNAKEEHDKVRAYNHQQDQNRAAAQRLKTMLVEKEDNDEEASGSKEPAQDESLQERRQRIKREEMEKKLDLLRKNQDPDFHEPDDNVQLHVDGWKQRYYELKFGDEVGDDVDKFGRHVADEYFKGLCWVLLYYYQGCPDWKWYFPFHYAPFASDFGDCVKMDTTFDGDAKPFNPLEQLMAVFPAASSKNLPPTWRKLMSDPESPILHFYPESFKIDLNGKKAAWMGVALLPFINETELFGALKDVYGDLSDHEKLRNTRGDPLIFVSKSHSRLAKTFEELLKQNALVDIPKDEDLEYRIIAGKIQMSPRFTPCYKELICTEFFDPIYPKGYVFPARLLSNVIMPGKVLKPQDMEQFDRYRPQIGMNPRNDRAHMDRSAHNMINHGVERHNQYGHSVHSNYKSNRGGGGGYNNSRNQAHPYARNDSRGGGGGGGRGGGYNNRGSYEQRRDDRGGYDRRNNDRGGSGGYQRNDSYSGGYNNNSNSNNQAYGGYSQGYNQGGYNQGGGGGGGYTSTQQRPNYAGRRGGSSGGGGGYNNQYPNQYQSNAPHYPPPQNPAYNYYTSDHPNSQRPDQPPPPQAYGSSGQGSDRYSSSNQRRYQ